MGPNGWEVAQRNGGVRIHQPSHIATGDFSRGQGAECPPLSAKLIGEVSHRDGGVRIHHPSRIATGDFSRGQGAECPPLSAKLIGEVSHRDGGVRIHQHDDGDFTALQ